MHSASLTAVDLAGVDLEGLLKGLSILGACLDLIWHISSDLVLFLGDDAHRDMIERDEKDIWRCRRFYRGHRRMTRQSTALSERRTPRYDDLLE